MRNVNYLTTFTDVVREPDFYVRIPLIKPKAFTDNPSGIFLTTCS
jgi:hypothetical protein